MQDTDIQEVAKAGKEKRGVLSLKSRDVERAQGMRGAQVKKQEGARDDEGLLTGLARMIVSKRPSEGDLDVGHGDGSVNGQSASRQYVGRGDEGEGEDGGYDKAWSYTNCFDETRAFVVAPLLYLEQVHELAGMWAFCQVDSIRPLPASFSHADVTKWRAQLLFAMSLDSDRYDMLPVSPVNLEATKDTSQYCTLQMLADVYHALMDVVEVTLKVKVERRNGNGAGSGSPQAMRPRPPCAQCGATGGPGWRARTSSGVAMHSTPKRG